MHRSREAGRLAAVLTLSAAVVPGSGCRCGACASAAGHGRWMLDAHGEAAAWLLLLLQAPSLTWEREAVCVLGDEFVLTGEGVI